MRFALVSSLAASIAIGALATTAAAAPDARLGGDFRMVGKVLTSRNFDNQAGDRVVRKYKFRPQCPIGVCRVTFYRQRGDGKFVKSTMYRRDPGIYRSVDRKRGACTRDGRIVGYATVRTRTIVTILRAENGRATRIRADVLVTAAKTRNCAYARQTVRLTGNRL